MVTPLKKTPPQFAEEVANLSPAKSSKPTFMVQGDIAMNSLNSQTSLGFTQYGTSNNTAPTSDDSSSVLSSDSGEEEPSTEQPERGLTFSVGQNSSNQTLGTTHRQHLAAPLRQPHKRRKKGKSRDSIATKKKNKMSDNLLGSGVDPKAANTVNASQVSAGVKAAASDSSGLLVSISLSDVKIGKPKATVEPYNVRSTTSNRRSTLDSIAEAEDSQSRDRYSRLGVQGDDYVTGLLPIHDYHMGSGGPGGRGERPRGHGHGGTGRWERDGPRDHRSYGVPRSGGRGGDYGGRGHGHNWDREYRGSAEEYWPDSGHYDGPSRGDPQRVGRTYPRKMDPEYFMQEARRRKKEADKIMVYTCVV